MQKKFEISTLIGFVIAIPILCAMFWGMGFMIGYFVKGYCYATNLCGM